MKHCVRKLALVLVLALLLSTLTLAADDTDRATVTVTDSSATLVFNDSTQSNLTLTKTGVTDGGMYLVLVLAGKEGENGTPLVPTESNILYINQATADENGIVTFDNVYPSRIQDSTVYLSGTGLDGLTKMGFIDLNVTLGDVDGDGEVTPTDASYVLRVAALLNTFDEKEKAAADVDGDGEITALDGSYILRYAAKLIDKFPME